MRGDISRLDKDNLLTTSEVNSAGGVIEKIIEEKVEEKMEE